MLHAALRTWRICVGVAVAGAVTGCAHSPSTQDQTQGTLSLAQPVFAAEGGIEWRTLTLSVEASVIAGTFADFEQGPSPLAPPLRSLWEGSGVRILQIPSDRAEALQAELVRTSESAETAAGASLSRLPINPGPRWVDALRDGGSAQPRVIALADSRQPIEAGIVRLLARCWPEPRMTDSDTVDAVVRLEIMPQWVEAGLLRRPRALDELTGVARVRGIEDQGVSIRRMLAAIDLGRNQSLVLLFETPGVSWAAEPAAPAEAATTESPPPGLPPGPGQVQRGPRTPADTEAKAPARSPVPGPQVPEGAGFRSTTLGEILLTVRSSRPSDAGEKAAQRVIVFISPRVPEKVSFLPR
ncbi:MAG: hypothetical protein ACKVS8_05630 [Phycisphaerales bacterium]